MSITITSPTDNQVFRRDANHRADIAITGTCSSDAVLEANWNNTGWFTIATASGGAFSGTLPARQAFYGNAQGDLIVRFKATPSDSARVRYVGIGDVILITGQSNASGRGTANQPYTPPTSHPQTLPAIFSNGFAWKLAVDPIDRVVSGDDAVSRDASAAGSCWMRAAGAIMEQTGVPVAFVPCALGSTSVLEWQPGVDHADRATLYGSAQYKRGLVGGCTLNVMWLGETDSADGTTQATFNSRLDTFANTLAADQAGLRTMPCKLMAISGADETAVNAAIAEAWGDNANVATGPDLSDIASDDSFHAQADAKLITIGGRWATAINALLTVAPRAPTAGRSGGFVAGAI